MKCQKCAKPAVVHLTEVINDSGGAKRAVEIHLCLGHAAEAGLIAAETGLLAPPAGSLHKKSNPAKEMAEELGLTAIEPASTGGLTVLRAKEGGDLSVCPVCGLTWGNFKQSGLMGCARDYQLFEGKLTPLLKRAQEGATEHVGKVPSKRKTKEMDRQVASLRLRRELQKALDAENYEQAARLRDQLRTLDAN